MRRARLARYQKFSLISSTVFYPSFFLFSSRTPRKYINSLVLIRPDVAKPRIKQSPTSFRREVGKVSSHARARAYGPGRAESGAVVCTVEIARTNEQSILELLPARSGKKRIKTALFLLLRHSSALSFSLSNPREAFGNYSTLSFSLAFHLPFSMPPLSRRAPSGSVPESVPVLT